ncbi:MAG: GAF domain-containing protein [Candidatus Scalindua rubra]|nr:GAF domain-containing protein [Candidatus Scalindua rubra]TWU30779.1 Adenylate cyclase 1 [Candidatus Brocadiaceae bacterium S225]
MGAHIVIYDVNDKLIFSNKHNLNDPKHSSSSCRYPLEIVDNVIGWIIGDKSAGSVADFVNFIVNKEYEEKALVGDLLDKYKEITLLYDISEELSVCIERREIEELIIAEIKKLIKATNVSILLREDHERENVSASTCNTSETITCNINGIAGSVLLSGKAEIVNDVDADPRYIISGKEICSLICAPLKIKDRVLGVLNVSSDEPVVYESSDLKILSILASQAASAIENTILFENKLKEAQIRANLQRYVAPQIVNSIVNDGGVLTLKPARKNISILFSDIRNFSATCEKLNPEQIVTYLNEYFSDMVGILFHHNGTINKFVGDMIVALFGAPSSYENRETQAIKAAIDMQKCINDSDTKWIKDNFRTGIGISAGSVIVGNVGSPDHMDYTAIGDEVNVADRLQSLAKGGQILVERNVYEVTKDIFEFNNFAHIKVKGRAAPVDIFEVVY